MTPEASSSRSLAHGDLLSVSADPFTLRAERFRPGMPLASTAPLSCAQEAVWFQNEFGGGRATRVELVALRISGPLTVLMLEEALNEVIARHDSLRMGFLAQDGQPAQQPMAGARVTLPVVHIGAEGNAELASRLAAFREEQAARPRDLAGGDMCGAVLFRVDALHHVLVMAVSALACDRGSATILLGELAACYAGLVSGVRALGRLAPASSYAEYARRQRQRVASAEVASSVEYWKRQLAGSEPAIDLPRDLTGAPETGALQTLAEASLTLPPAVGEKLAAFAQAAGTCARELMVATFQVLLHRWSSQPDIVIGELLDDRGDAANAAVGNYGCALPRRVEISGEESFRSFLTKSAMARSEALAHVLPAEVLVPVLRPAQAMERSPLFMAVAEWREEPEAVESGGARFSLVEIPADRSPYDLHLAVTRSAAGWRVALGYRPDWFAPETAQRLLRSWETLLQGIVADPECRIARLPVVPADDLRRMLVDWNDTALPYSRDLCVQDAFARQVRATPDAVAVVGETERWTYRQLDAAAEQVAAALRARGVGPDSLVGVFLHRTPRLIAGMLGVMKAGGAYVPLDPGYPPDRLQFIMEDTAMTVLVTESELAGQPVPAGVKQVMVDMLPVAGEAPVAERRAQPEHLAYVIYTSGSTGKPKGVCIPHRAVMAFIAWGRQLYSAEELNGVFFSTSACFDVSVFETWVPLCLGGKIIVAPNILEIAGHPAREEVTLMSGVPSAMAEVVRQGAIPANVRTINVAGEPCPQSLVDAVYALGHVRQLYDVYGPTETTVYSVGGPRRAGGRPTIGKPLPNERAYVLDAAQQPVPCGVRGELYIGGEKLARGYLNRPELTAEKFVEVAALPGERLYRTGDAVRWLADGTLEYLGRLDRQVKIRGFRVEPGEVENLLRRHEAVKECAVVPRDDGRGVKFLAAYVVPAGKADVAQLRRHLEERLPDYLVPSSFVLLAALPKAPNGKLDVRALPAPGLSPDRETRRTLPRDAVELQLVRIWEEVLGVKPIGIDDRFTDLGGHSLLALRMVAEVEKRLGRKIPLSILFRAPTVERLAAVIRDEGLVIKRSCVVDIQPEGKRTPIFWLHTLGGGGGAGLFRYEKLARRLDPDQPSFGIIAPSGEQPATFEEMAARYVREIRLVQPDGPYVLGGYCFGGILAYEVARQLRASGAVVSQVLIIDAEPPNVAGLPDRISLPFALHVTRTFFPWLLHSLKQHEKLVSRLRSFLRRGIRSISSMSVQTGGLEPTARLEDFIDMSRYPAEYRAYAAAHWQAMTRYRPGAYDGAVTLLRPHRPTLLRFAPEFQWRRVAPAIRVRFVAGNHEDLLEEPQAAMLGAVIREELDPHRN